MLTSEAIKGFINPLFWSRTRGCGVAWYQTLRILKDHGFKVGYKSGDESVTSIHYETFLPMTNFPNGTALVPMDQIGWRMISELMEYTSTKDQHYTNSPKDRGQDAWRALEPVDLSLIHI